MAHKVKWKETDVSLHRLIDSIKLEEIMTYYDAQKPDEFGCKICEHVLISIEKLLRTQDFCIKTRRLQADGDTPLHAIPEFIKLKEIMPVADTKFCRDQWGSSNLSNPDGVWLIEVCTPDGRCRACVPLFVEVDSGAEGKFKNQPRIMAMKMWQHVSVGHWIPKAAVVTTLRIETQLVSKMLAQRAAEGRDGFTPQTLVVQHLRDLTGACAEILYGITMSCVLAHFGSGSGRDPKEFYDPHFFQHLLPSMQDKERRDFHFFVGPFGLKTFDIGSERLLSPDASRKTEEWLPEITAKQKIANLYTEFAAEATLIPQQDAGASISAEAAPDRYFKQRQIKNNEATEHAFLKITKKNEETDKHARYLDGFWEPQRKWSCSIGCQQMDFDKYSTTFGTATYLHSRVPMHCVHVQRADVSALVVPPLKETTTTNGVGQSTTQPAAVHVDMPNGMFYIDDIFTALDMFIKQAHEDPLKRDFTLPYNAAGITDQTQITEIDEFILFNMLSESFRTRAHIRIPPSNSYHDLTLSRGPDEPHNQFFYEWSGFHLFVEPFMAAMENTLFTITKNTVAITEDFQSYSKQMTAFKRNIARGEVQLDLHRQCVTFPTTPDPAGKLKLKAKSLNLASRCLWSYNEEELDQDLEEFLFRTLQSGGGSAGRQQPTLNNQYLVLVCKWFKCHDKASLAALVRHYTTNDTIRKSIDTKLAGFPEGVRSEILFMFEVVFNDTQFLVQKKQTEKLYHFAFHDNDLENGTIHLFVRVHWLPYELEVSFDRPTWKSETVYTMSRRGWQNIDTGMEVADFDNKDLLKSKNLVKKLFGKTNPDAMTEFTPPKSSGARLWPHETQLVENDEDEIDEQQHAGFTLGWLFSGEWKDRTRLLRALSLTNLETAEWEEINKLRDLKSKCAGEPPQDAEREIQNEMQAVLDWQSEKFPEVDAAYEPWEPFVRPSKYERKVPGGYRISDIERLSTEQHRTTLTKPKYSKVKAVLEDGTDVSTRISNALDTCKIDDRVQTSLRGSGGYVQKYFEWIETSHDYLFFMYDKYQLELKELKDNTGKRANRPEKKPDHTGLSLFEFVDKQRAIPELNRKDIILHEALGTYFGVGYGSQQKRGKMRYYLHERFPILTKRYLPYKLWTEGKLSQAFNAEQEFRTTHVLTRMQKNQLAERRFKCASIFIEDIVHAVKAYQNKFFARQFETRLRVTFNAEEFAAANENKVENITKRVEIGNFLFENTQVFARHLHIMWTWKWLAVKASCIHSYRDWFLHRRYYEYDAANPPAA